MPEELIARKVNSTDPIFGDRVTRIYTTDEVYEYPIPDGLVLCNGCNKNLHPDPVWALYIDGTLHDVYCRDCLDRYFPGARKESES